MAHPPRPPVTDRRTALRLSGLAGLGMTATALPAAVAAASDPTVTARQNFTVDFAYYGGCFADLAFIGVLIEVADGIDPQADIRIRLVPDGEWRAVHDEILEDEPYWHYPYAFDNPGEGRCDLRDFAAAISDEDSTAAVDVALFTGPESFIMLATGVAVIPWLE